MRSRHRAFTLIELMLSMVLSVGIVLLAYHAFRQATRTMSAMQRQATENGMLRGGYFAVMEDADFWHSQANPDYPYLKGFMSDEVATVEEWRDGNTPVLREDANNAANKRLFRRVDFPKAFDDPRNPNWQQPNDRRTWYRNYLLANPPAISRKRDKEDEYRATWSRGDALRPGGAVGTGWHPWHLHGDFSQTANLAMDRKATTDDADSQRGARPVLLWHLHKKLGQHGVAGYAQPGTINLFVRPATNLTAEAIGSQDLNYDKGEIPWSLTSPRYPKYDANGKPMGPMIPESVLVPGPRVRGVTNLDNELGHYAQTMPSYHIDANKDYDRNWILPQWPFATDLDLCSGQIAIPMALLYGSRAFLRDEKGKSFDFERQVNARTKSPYDYLDWDMDFSTFVSRRRELINTTWHVPSLHTDHPDPDIRTGRPKGVPAMATSIFRFRQKSADRAMCAVQVIDDLDGHEVQLRFSATTTTWRGARQHWGWKTATDASTTTAADGPKPIVMGDVYQ